MDCTVLQRVAVLSCESVSDNADCLPLLPSEEIVQASSQVIPELRCLISLRLCESRISRRNIPTETLRNVVKMVKPALLEVSGVPATVIWTEKENKATQKEIEREFSQSQFTLAPRRCSPYQRIQSSSVVKLVGHHSCGADRLPVAVRFPAGPRVRLKTVDPPKSNGLGQKKPLPEDSV